MGVDPDDTVRLNVERRRGVPPGPGRWLAAGLVGVVLAGGGAWVAFQPAAPGPGAVTEPARTSSAERQAARLQAGEATSTTAPPAVAIPTVPIPAPGASSGSVPAIAAAIAPPGETLDVDPGARLRPSLHGRAAPGAPPVTELVPADEAALLADSPTQMRAYRFTPKPGIVVLQFPTLAEQALMLNRVAAFIEKQGYPHDRVLPRAELDSMIVASGASLDRFYYGHDYRSADLIRFFAAAEELDPSEAWLRALLQREGWEAPGTEGALISFVRLAPGEGVDASARATILRHELSHGVYFTDPAYRAFCLSFWQTRLTASERERFISFLGSEGYDTSLPDLMVNETQAYLMFTADPRFFGPAAVRMTPARLAELRSAFAAEMPPGWLRDVALAR